MVVVYMQILEKWRVLDNVTKLNTTLLYEQMLGFNV